MLAQQKSRNMNQQHLQISLQVNEASKKTNKHYAQTISRLNNTALHLKQQQQQQQHYYQQLRGQQHPYLQPANYEPLSMYRQQADRSVPPLPLMHSAPLPPKQTIHYQTPTSIYQHPYAQPSHHQRESLMFVNPDGRQSLLNKPLCRCRVMYLGSSVPHITKNGLHGIQEPLRHLYPEEQFLAKRSADKSDPSTIDISHLSSSLGIDSWLSVWSNGLLLENVDEFGREIKRFFSIETLHYCAAVRFFDTKNLMSAETSGDQQAKTFNGSSTFDGKRIHNGTNLNSPDDEITIDQNNNITEPTTCEVPLKQQKSMVRFLPLDAPLFQWPGMVDANHPPVFAAILRRTTGVKVLECHAFICRRDAASNALVRCCTQAYADFLSAKRLSLELGAKNHLSSQSYYEPNDKPASRRRRSTSRRRSSHGSGGSSGGKQTKEVATRAYESLVTPNSQREESQQLLIGTQSISADRSLAYSPISGDHYAIISKHSTAGNGSKGQKKSKKSEGQGSSKSLYNDFQPKEAKDNCEKCDMEKLSHSLDLLDIRTRQAATCCDSGSPESFCATPNKRHSRSMQNLEGGAEILSTRRRRTSVSSGCSALSTASGQKRHRRKRASSLHELAQPTYEPVIESERMHPPQTSEQLSDHVNNLYSSCLDTDLSTGIHEANDQESDKVANPTSTTSSGRSRSNRRRRDVEAKNRSSSGSSRRHRRQQQMQPLELHPSLPVMGGPSMLMSPNGGYYATPASVHPAHYALYSPLSHTPLPSQAGGGHPLYLAPGMYLPANYHPNHAATHRQSHNGLGAVYATPYNHTQAFASATMGRAPKGTVPSSSALAAALPCFRCLSPPMKLLGAKASAKTKPTSAKEPDLSKIPPAHLGETERGSPEITMSPAPSQVVSGRPVFLGKDQRSTAVGHPSGKKMSWIKRLSLTMSPAAASAVTPQLMDQDAISPEAAGADLSANSTAPKQPRQRKKRASLFSGSLTIGRRGRPKQQHQQPHQGEQSP